MTECLECRLWLIDNLTPASREALAAILTRAAAWECEIYRAIDTLWEESEELRLFFPERERLDLETLNDELGILLGEFNEQEEGDT